MRRKDYVQNDCKPQSLTKEEIEDPHDVLHEFFSCTDLPTTREELWSVMLVMVRCDFNADYITQLERQNLLYFFERMKKLLEIAHIIYQQQKSIH